MPRGWYPYALTNYSPLLTSVPTPEISSATQAPLICVQMSAALVPYIIGALELYRWRDKFRGDSAQVDTALGVMQDLIAILTEGNNCGEGDMPTSFRFTSDCGLEYTNDNGTNWIAVPGWSEFAATCFQGPQGPQGETGATGLPGADGQPVELRVYFGTIQWRVVGDAVWNHLINLSEITGADGQDGADGPPIELRTYFGTIQWRVVGTTPWNHLINLSEVCECEEPEPVNPNPLTDGLLCAIAFRVAAEIRRVWDYAFTNPNNQVTQVAAGTSATAGLVALLFPGVAVTAAVIGTISGFAGFLSEVLDNSETNSFTLATEYYLAGLIYCELVRRQQRSIDKDLLVDIVSKIEDAPDLTERQKTALISFILAAPLVVWAWAAQAAAPYPDGSACASTVCPDDSDSYWCVQLFDDSPLYTDFLAFHPLLQHGMVTVSIGRLSIDSPESYAADSTYGYPFLPDIADPYPQRELRLLLTFPRPTRIDRLQFEVFYNQTAATATGNLLKVVTDDGTVLINQPTVGVTGGGGLSETIEWWGDKEVKSLTITGQVWATELWTDIAAALRITQLKIQGQGYNPFKPLTNCIWEEQLNPLPEHDWCVDFNFRGSKPAPWEGQPNAFSEPPWVAGRGFVSVTTQWSIGRRMQNTRAETSWGGATFENGARVTGMDIFYSNGFMSSGAGPMEVTLRRGAGAVHAENFASYNGSGYKRVLVTTPNDQTNGVTISAKTRDDYDPEVEFGTLDISRVVIWGTGTPPPWPNGESC